MQKRRFWIDFLMGLTSYVKAEKISRNDKKNGKLYEYEGEDEIEFKRNDGKKIFKLLKDVAFLKAAPDSAHGVKNDDESVQVMKRRLYTKDGRHYLLTGVDLAWLFTRPAGTIVLDPTVALTPPPDDVWIEYNKTNNYNSYAQLRIGRGGGYGWKRSLVKFDVSSIPFSANIQSAQIQLYFYGKYGTPVERDIHCHQVLQYWIESQATWFNRFPGTAWNTAGVGFNNIDARSVSEDRQIWFDEYPSWKAYNIAGLVQRWVDGTDPNHGVIFRAANETAYTNKDEKWVYSSEYTGDTGKRPRLVVTYDADVLAEYEYDASGRPETVHYANGVQEINQYDSDKGWLIRRDYKQGSTNIFYFRNTVHDNLGNIKQQKYKHNNDAEQTMDYLYDDLNRLITFKYNGNTLRSYNYDKNGNITTFTGSTLTYASNTNRLTHDGAHSYTFDQAGRVTQIGSLAVSYDLCSNMTGYAPSSAYAGTYSYDAFNQRIYKYEENAATYYITSGQQVLAEYDNSSNLETEYLYGLAGMMAKMHPERGVIWFYKDHLGSNRQVGVGEMVRDYYPYGEAYAAAGDETAYRFSGKELDKSSELYYFGSRYYNPYIARWLAPDPAGQGWSPYMYCGNSPMMMVDPDGEWFFPAIMVAKGIYTGLKTYNATGDFALAFAQGALSFGRDYLTSEFTSSITPFKPTGNYLTSALSDVGNYAIRGGIQGGFHSRGNFLDGFMSGVEKGIKYSVATQLVAGTKIGWKGIDENKINNAASKYLMTGDQLKKIYGGVYRGGLIPTIITNLLDYGAIEGPDGFHIGWFSKMSNVNSSTLISHEFFHLIQMEESTGGIYGYGIKYLYNLLKHGYDNHPFEKEAYFWQNIGFKYSFLGLYPTGRSIPQSKIKHPDLFWYFLFNKL